ncbi:MAG TPA: SDR family NAD(P)-dependent oxidoreductase [Anaerolineales bacterium]|nr:SDR family NAD(P)-dependent oxidoreductase [Anaerolineales bacterium]
MDSIKTEKGESLAVERMGLARDTLAMQVAIVTGGGRGIGREVARALAWLEARVIIAELSDEGQETERLIREAGGEARFVRTDVSNPDDVAQLARLTQETFGPADILINNAILCPVAPVLEMDVDLWDQVLAVNLRGAFLTCQAFLPEMVARKRGVIVNMTSLDAMPGLSAYIASKQALVGFSQSLAAEVGPRGARVIAFAPGMVDTPGIREVAERLPSLLGMTREQFLSLPLHRAYQGLMPADHAGAATAFLVGALADVYHGETITGYEVLERSGFLQTPAFGEMTPAPPHPGRELSPGLSHSQVVERALALCRKLQAVIEETGAGFNRLPVFVRPMARSGFMKKAGGSLEDWARTLAGLATQLEGVAASDSAAEQALRAGLPGLQTSLVKLRIYFQEVPEETARFSRDAKLLRQVQQASAEQAALIVDLLAALEAIQ